MEIYKILPATMLAAGLALSAGAGIAQTSQDKAVSMDRDARANGPTADNQKNNKQDLMLVQKIRRSITSDKSLSTAAHNVKVIVQNGQITLRGPVRSEEEKRSVETKATEVAGAGKVTNEITIASTVKSEKHAQKEASKTAH